MFVERMINQGNLPLIERMMKLTAQRHELLADNIVNASTPGYQQKDVDVSKFQQMLLDRVDARRQSGPGMTSFDDLDPANFKNNPRMKGMLFHDRSNRSIETLMSDFSSNAIRYNLFTEMLRKQYGSFDNVLRERVS
jgi:flagellar basal-body rod protein FlgB